MELSRALADGDTFLKNAQEALERKVLREDQLYIWENQVEVLDSFLADTEDLAGSSAELKGLRDRLRAQKREIEKKTMEFLAQQEKTEMPEELDPKEEASLMVEPGQELLAIVDKALKKNVGKIEHVAEWEEPLMMVNSFLADSETFVALDKDLLKVRTDLKGRKRDLEKRIQDVVTAWRASDAAGGDEDEE